MNRMIFGSLSLFVWDNKVREIYGFGFGILVFDARRTADDSYTEKNIFFSMHLSLIVYSILEIVRITFFSLFCSMKYFVGIKICKTVLIRTLCFSKSLLKIRSPISKSSFYYK